MLNLLKLPPLIILPPTNLPIVNKELLSSEKVVFKMVNKKKVILSMISLNLLQKMELNLHKMELKVEQEHKVEQDPNPLHQKEF